MQYQSIEEIIYKSIMKSDIDVRREMYNNICLFGGTCFIPGFPERIRKELSVLLP